MAIGIPTNQLVQSESVSSVETSGPMKLNKLLEK